MTDADLVIKRIIDPVSDDPDEVYASCISAFESFDGDRSELLDGLRRQKAVLRARNVPGNTSEPVIEGTYLDDIPGILVDDSVYRFISYAECRLDPTAIDDVDLRTVSQLYLELVDIVAVDYREACERCRSYPSESNIGSALRCIGLMTSLLKAAASQLSVHSTESPATFHTKGCRSIARCGEYTDRVLVGTAIDAPELRDGYDSLKTMFNGLCGSASLNDIQQERNRRYREDRKWIHEWLTRKVMEMNSEMESLDPTDMTQRRYLSQLIALSQDALNDFETDH